MPDGSEIGSVEMPTCQQSSAIWRKLKRRTCLENKGDPLGCLQWTDFRTGKVRRWIVRIGDRSDRVTLETPSGKRTKSHGMAWMLEKIRAVILRR